MQNAYFHYSTNTMDMHFSTRSAYSMLKTNGRQNDLNRLCHVCKQSFAFQLFELDIQYTDLEDESLR